MTTPTPPVVPVMRLADESRPTTGLGRTARRMPAVLARTARLAWRADRPAVVCMVVAQVTAAALAALALTATTAVLAAGLDMATAHSTGRPVTPLLSAATTPCVTLVLALAGTALADAAARAAAARLGPKCSREADLQVLDAAARVELIAYEHPGFEDALDAAGKGAESARDLVADAQSLISTTARLAAVALVVATLDPILLALLLLAAAPRAVASLRAARVEHAAVHASRADSRLRQSLRGYSTDRNTAAEIRASAMGPFLSTRYRQVSDRLEHDVLTAALRSLRVQLTGDAASSLALAGCFAALAWMVTVGRIDLAAAGTALFALRTASAALTTLTRAAARVFRTGLYLDDWAAFLTDAERHRTRRGTLQLPAGPPALIAARNVSFTYPGAERPALDRLDFDLRSGELVAVIGENGAGKSTLVQLLTGLYLPDTGAVRWDGLDLADVDPASVWAKLALTPQDYTRWPLTARENIHLGTPRPEGDHAVMEAARASGADTVLAALPQGLDTSLARSWWGGHDLSGGQWQRLALARSFHADAPVHILDEPTAALDARAEHQVLQRFRALTDARAGLFVTHRLASARIADRVVVLHHGRVTESGTYDELLHQPGSRFAELHQLQSGTELVP
ncbi:ABC transporter ATP-binding protein [Streptomyces koyangensis]|uniref:ABC transporter ATP-binding protein n=1 Tax=Streptomyces koyangensis TaxID=188770 RepID=UPI003390CC8B